MVKAVCPFGSRSPKQGMWKLTGYHTGPSNAIAVATGIAAPRTNR
jgi:hypothetical protein